MFKNIKFVLIQTTHSGNVGAAARSIKNMGFESLVLVAPLKFPDAEATARASGAKDILANAVICKNLDEAIGDCQLVFGLSARERKIAWPILEPEIASLKTLEFLQCRTPAREKRLQDAMNIDSIMLNCPPHEVQVAFVFGQEQFGLTNAQLEKCHYQVRIPANPDYSSLNLAQSIQIVSYELRKVFSKNFAMKKEALEADRKEDTPAESLNEMKKINVIRGIKQVTIRQMEGFYRHLEKILLKINFLDQLQSPHLMTLLRRLFNKADLDGEELNILRGILTAVEKRV